MQAEKAIYDFLKSLIDSTKLSKYIPEGYDFGLDPWDPVIINTLVHYKMERENHKDVNVEMVLFNSLKRHCPVEVRYEIYEKLLALKEKVKGKDVKLLKNALIGLEEIMIEPGMIGIVFELYRNDVHKAIRSLTTLEKNDNINNDELSQAIINYSGESDLELIRANVKAALLILEHELLHQELPKERFRKLLKLVFKLPCHQAASLLTQMYYCNKISLQELLNGCNGKMKNLVTTHIYDNVCNFEATFSEKWYSYAFLSQIKDERVIMMQIEELWDIQEYKAEQDVLLDFYQEITRDLIALKDRRAVPAFIRFLYNAASQGIPTTIIDEIDLLLTKTSWYKEIQKGLHLLHQGENIFIDEEEKFQDWILKKVNKYIELQTRLAGVSPDENKIKLFYDNQQALWDEAYHKGIEWLRPVDIGVSQAGLKLEQLMYDSFFNKNRGLAPSDPAVEEKINDYRAEWMITPLTSDPKSAPMVQIIKDRERQATSTALKDYFKKSKKETVNSLYHQAVAEFENNNHALAKKILDTLLSIEPGYPFALRLKKQFAG